MNLTSETFGPLLREAREAAKLTQQQLATEGNVAISTLSHIEAGKASPNIGTAYRLWAVVGYEIHAISK